MARPTDYKEEYNEQARKLCLLLNAQDTELAKYFGVSEVTLNAWKTKYPEFLKSIKDGKENADYEVGKKLYEKAVGYKKKETQLFHYKGDVIEHDVDVHYQPDITAIIFWLCNRQRDKWKRGSIESDDDNRGGNITINYHKGTKPVGT